MLRHAVWQKLTDILEVLAASEMSVNFYQITQHNIPEDKSSSFLAL
jgi:hypothetical protein